VAQSRNWLPDPVGGIFWFGVDDADGCVYCPMYCGIRKIPESYATGNGSMVTWSENSAFWTFSQVNNWGYSRYDLIHPDVEKYQAELESRLLQETAIVDARAGILFARDQNGMKEYTTDYSVYTGNLVVSKWKEFYRYLFMKYMDGNVKQSKDRELIENGFGKGVPKKPSQPGYGKEWEKRMVEGTGDRLKEKESK
jgi:dipeptidase